MRCLEAPSAPTIKEMEAAASSQADEDRIDGEPVLGVTPAWHELQSVSTAIRYIPMFENEHGEQCYGEPVLLDQLNSRGVSPAPSSLLFTRGTTDERSAVGRRYSATGPIMEGNARPGDRTWLGSGAASYIPPPLYSSLIPSAPPFYDLEQDSTESQR